MIDYKSSLLTGFISLPARVTTVRIGLGVDFTVIELVGGALSGVVLTGGLTLTDTRTHEGVVSLGRTGVVWGLSPIA